MLDEFPSAAKRQFVFDMRLVRLDRLDAEVKFFRDLPCGARFSN
jgi:hypothetical protein